MLLGGRQWHGAHQSGFQRSSVHERVWGGVKLNTIRWFSDSTSQEEYFPSCMCKCVYVCVTFPKVLLLRSKLLELFPPPPPCPDTTQSYTIEKKNHSDFPEQSLSNDHYQEIELSALGIRSTNIFHLYKEIHQITEANDALTAALLCL